MHLLSNNLTYPLVLRDTDISNGLQNEYMEFTMDTNASDSCLVVERMIREGSITTLELQDLLDTLENQRLISAQEHAELLGLADCSDIEKTPFDAV